jgi:hypothetical protein
MSSQDLAVRTFRRRLAALLLGRQAVGLTALWLFVWGCAVIALRAAAGVDRLPLLWGLAGLPVCLVFAWLIARRQVPGVAAVRALLDRVGHCGGLLMAGDERPLGAWERELPQVSLPQLRWRARRAWGLLLAGAAFTAAAFLLPQRLAALGTNPPLDVGNEVERLAQQLDVLKEEKLLDPARAEDLKQKLDKIREEARGKDPSRTLEALDHLEDLVRKTAQESAEDALRKTEQMSREESLAEALRKARNDKGVSDKVRAEALAILSRETKKSAAETEQLGDELDPELAQALEKNELSEADLKKLADALREAKGKLKGRLGKLHKARLIDAKALKDCDNCGEDKADELLAYLKECRGGS